GTGLPQRDFIHADDLADACVFAMEHYDGDVPLNVGTGQWTSIADLARQIAHIVGYEGRLEFDVTKPDGMPFKGLDASPLHKLGWMPHVSLSEGLASTYDWFLTHVVNDRAARSAKI